MRLSGWACISSNLIVSVRMRLSNSAWSSASADPPSPNNKHPVISNLMKETIAHRWKLCNKAGCRDYAVWGEARPSTDAEARCLATASAIVATLWRTSRARSGVGILSPYFLSSATTSWRASTESKPRLPGPKRVCSSLISSVVICSMRFSTINCLISRLSVPFVSIISAAILLRCTACDLVSVQASQNANVDQEWAQSRVHEWLGSYARAQKSRLVVVEVVVGVLGLGHSTLGKVDEPRGHAGLGQGRGQTGEHRTHAVEVP